MLGRRPGRYHASVRMQEKVPMAMSDTLMCLIDNFEATIWRLTLSQPGRELIKINHCGSMLCTACQYSVEGDL